MPGIHFSLWSAGSIDNALWIGWGHWKNKMIFFVCGNLELIIVNVVQRSSLIYVTTGWLRDCFCCREEDQVCIIKQMKIWNGSQREWCHLTSYVTHLFVYTCPPTLFDSVTLCKELRYFKHTGSTNACKRCLLASSGPSCCDLYYRPLHSYIYIGMYSMVYREPVGTCWRCITSTQWR